jgi:uncharacterized surface protein with fasciclin (FAS1) repeats
MNLQKLFGLLFLSMLLLASCGDDEATTETNTIVDIALADSQFSTLVTALERTNLVTTLQGSGPFTVFAPTNAAFAALGVDLNTLSDQQLTDILLYHVLGGAIQSTDLSEGQTYASTASASGPGGTNLSILIERSGNSVRLNNNSSVSAANVIADNGVIHIIDNVLLPLDLVGHAVANSNFSTLVGALSSAPGDLVNVLSGNGPFTVFAPLDAAFADIASTVASLSPAQLTTVLTYHVVANANVRSTDLVNDTKVMTVSGQEFTVHLTDGAQLLDQTNTKSNIVLTDVQATNGIIHVLSRVIIPNL